MRNPCAVTNWFNAFLARFIMTEKYQVLQESTMAVLAGTGYFV